MRILVVDESPENRAPAQLDPRGTDESHPDKADRMREADEAMCRAQDAGRPRLRMAGEPSSCFP